MVLVLTVGTLSLHACRYVRLCVCTYLSLSLFANLYKYAHACLVNNYLYIPRMVRSFSWTRFGCAKEARKPERRPGRKEKE